MALEKAKLPGAEIPMYASHGRVTGLPEPVRGVYYVVTTPVAQTAPDRDDLLVCGPAVLDENDQVVGCKGLAVPNHAAAASEQPRRFRSRAELEALHEPGPGHFPAEEFAVLGLAQTLRNDGVITPEEFALAEQDFGDEGTSHRPRS